MEREIAAIAMIPETLRIHPLVTTLHTVCDSALLLSVAWVSVLIIGSP